MIGKNTMARVRDVAMTARSRFPLILPGLLLYLFMPCSIRLKIFSVTTIPSSTTRPVASTIARSVSTLMEKPMMYMIKKAPRRDTGISINGRRAIVHSLKNKKMIMTTRLIAMISVSLTSNIALRTKVVRS